MTENSAAGQNGGVYYFDDQPGLTEAEYEKNPVGDFQFQVFLAVDVPGNGLKIGDNTITDNVTIYGGYWWGYQYSAVNTPEPATIVIWSLLGGLGITIGRRCRRKAA